MRRSTKQVFERKPLPPLDRKEVDSVLYMEAVWWPDGGYGGAKYFQTLEEAKVAAENSRKMGYGDGKNHRIHVVKVTRTLVGVVDNGEWKDL